MTQSIAIKPSNLPIGKITVSECTIEIGGGICGGAFAATRFQPIPSIKLVPQANDADVQRVAPLIERAVPIDDDTADGYTFAILPNVQRAWLRADPAAVESYRAKLHAYPRPWVGFNWAGGGAADNDLRNITPDYCKSEILALPGTLIDIQHQPSAAFDERVSRMRDFCQQIGRPLIRLDGFDPVADLADAAALFQVLDAVLAVDCTHAHLTPALGTPTFVIGRYARPGTTDVGISATLNPEQWCYTLELITPVRVDSWEDVLNQAAEKLTALYADKAA